MRFDFVFLVLVLGFLVPQTLNAQVVEKQCPGGTVLCSEQCVDLSTDLGNCGSCGVKCGAGESCVNGVCATGLVSGEISPSLPTAEVEEEAATKKPKPAVVRVETLPAGALFKLGEQQCHTPCQLEIEAETIGPELTAMVSYSGQSKAHRLNVAAGETLVFFDSFDSWSTSEVVSVVMWGLGGAALVTSVAFMSYGMWQQDSLNNLYKDTGAVTSDELDEAQELLDSIDNSQMLANTSLAVGGTLIAAGLITYFFINDSDDSDDLAFVLIPGQVGMGMRF